MSSFSLRQLNNSLVLVLGALAVILMLFLIYIQFGALGAARDAVAEGQTALNSERARLQELVNMKANAAVYEERLSSIERLMPAEPDEDVLLADIQACAVAAGMEVQQLRFEERSAQQGFTAMPVLAVFMGHYPELLSLLEQLDGGPRALCVEGMSIKRLNDDSTEIRAEITASAFCAAPQ